MINLENWDLENIKKAVNPTEILLVVDAMTGQDAINVIEGFNNKLKLDIIFTSYKGDDE